MLDVVEGRGISGGVAVRQRGHVRGCRACGCSFSSMFGKAKCGAWVGSVERSACAGVDARVLRRENLEVNIF